MGDYRSVLAPGLFADNSILVTGGGSGVGRCIAHELASLGAHVHIVGRTEQKLATVATEIEEDGGSVSLAACDTRDEERVAEVVADLIKARGPIHGLVNNAGGQFPSPLDSISAKGFAAVVRNNLFGSFHMAREVYTQSMRENGGSIVNITADCDNGFPGMGHTGAARAGMENLCKTAAWEWGPQGVRCNAVALGWIESSGLDTYDENMNEIFRDAARQIPLGRMATEAEASAVVCFLLSPAAGFINGDTIHLDGGGRFSSSVTFWPLPEEKSNPVPAFNGFHRATRPKVLEDTPDKN
ncbi:MAG: SDR family oxidoreductase [Pseudomonadota bacterium]